MARMTIAQMRATALERFTEKYIKDADKARNIVNRYYRICGLDERLLYMENDEATYTRHRRYIEDLEQRRDKALDRLNNDLKPYGLKAVYSGYCPRICEVEITPGRGTLIHAEALTPYFYG